MGVGVVKMCVMMGYGSGIILRIGGGLLFKFLRVESIDGSRELSVITLISCGRTCSGTWIVLSDGEDSHDDGFSRSFGAYLLVFVAVR